MEKTLRLLAAACNEPDHTVLGKLSIGDRDIMLLQLREWMFGRRLKNMSSCPRCGEKTEWETDATDLHLQAMPNVLSVKTFQVANDGYVATFRLPGSTDLAEAMKKTGGIPEEEMLLQRCITEAAYNGKPIQPGELPVHICEAIEKEMSEKDPQADIDMHIICPSCMHEWEAKFDIVSFLWAEIHNWAHRMLRDIYQLARAFGWSETDILNMSPRRRNLYLQMLRA